MSLDFYDSKPSILKNAMFAMFIGSLFCGCASSTQSQIFSNEPVWLRDTTYIKDKLSAVGCANIHIDGEAAQFKLATQRAIEQIALQKSSKVSVVSYRNQINHTSTSQTSSLQEVNQQDIKTKVVDMYKDNNDHRICVLVEEE